MKDNNNYYITFGAGRPWKDYYIKIIGFETEYYQNYMTVKYSNDTDNIEIHKIRVIQVLAESLYNKNYSMIYPNFDFIEDFFPKGCKKEYNIKDFDFLYEDSLKPIEYSWKIIDGVLTTLDQEYRKYLVNPFSNTLDTEKSSKLSEEIKEFIKQQFKKLNK